MTVPKRDLSPFGKLNTLGQPVGIKFLLFKPEGVEKLEENMAVCEMMKKAGNGDAFYAVQDNFTCVGPILTGMTEGDPVFESGSIGPSLHIFEEARANRRLYYDITTLGKGSVNYVAFAPLDKLTFDPDVLILATDSIHLEITLRALCYSTGKMWTSKGTPVIACSWLTTYPYISGEVNYIITDLSHGMRAKQVFPSGTILVSIPWDRLNGLAEDLGKIEWYPAMYTEGAEVHDRKFVETVTSLSQKLQAEQG